MQIPELLKFLKNEKVEFKPLCEVANLRAGDRIIKSMMNKNNAKYPVMGGGVEPTGYYHSYNFSQGITIARAGSAGSVNWQSSKFWATDVCFVASNHNPDPCTKRSEVSHKESQKDSSNKDSSVALLPLAPSE